MDKAFVVMGSAGIYPTDAASWAVAVYLTEEKALKHRDRATAQAAEFLAARRAEELNVQRIDEATAFDPFFRCYDGHVAYRVEALPFMENSNEVNMAMWHVLRANPALAPSEVELSEAEQARARQEFLSTLAKNSSPARKQPTNRK